MYSTEHVRHFAALTVNRYGEGAGYYLGTIVKQPEFYGDLAASLIEEAGITPTPLRADGVQVGTRESNLCSYVYYVNHLNHEVEIDVVDGKDILTGQRVTGPLRLEPFGVLIVKQPKNNGER